MSRRIALCCSLFLVISPTELGSQPQNKPWGSIPIVSGTGWQTCRDWARANQDFKLGYLIGQVEARAQVTNVLAGNPSAGNAKEMFETGAALTIGDYRKALDDFCADTYNTAIVLANAFGFVNVRLSGGPPPDDRVLSELRCLGAAGADEKKVRECYKLP
jgi:hypothetical protein